MAEKRERVRSEVDGEGGPQALVARFVVIFERLLEVHARGGQFSREEFEETAHAPREGGMPRQTGSLGFGEKGFHAGARGAVIAAHHRCVDAAIEEGPVFRRPPGFGGARRPMSAAFVSSAPNPLVVIVASA